MYKIIKTRLQHKRRTLAYPKTEPVVPDRLRGLPVIEANHCAHDCDICIAECPTTAIQRQEGAGNVQIDLGKCLFCGDCQRFCQNSVIHFSNDYRLSTSNRNDLVIDSKELALAGQMGEKMLKLFGRSLKLRQVSAGGCNGCEVDINVLTTTVYDIGRFGMQIVASPRHADGLIITGPVTENMRVALLKTYEAVPDPKIVIASGTCAISGGLFAGHSEVHNGVDHFLPVDLYIPGCPPHPLTILDGLLRLTGKL
jgi:Ni,Fe-hydrogenase III small subunit/formate hydrogenlyase subunit 6/NADH:ubiquinone oxidoreductase subunit I